MRVVPPEVFRQSFTCPFCDTTAVHYWYFNSTAHSRYGTDCSTEYVVGKNSKPFTALGVGPWSRMTSNPAISEWGFSECSNCRGLSVWHRGELVFPKACPVEDPSEDMPEGVLAIYMEAASVFQDSPRASAALLRLALQMLLQIILGEESKGSIRKDMETLRGKGARRQIIKAMDVVRFEGNESVHPGEIDINENREDAIALFSFLNLIVEEYFSAPARLEEIYKRIPERKRTNLE